jgi:hypothetical protein
MISSKGTVLVMVELNVLEVVFNVFHNNGRKLIIVPTDVTKKPI